MLGMIKKILLTGVFVLLATSAFGEYYQYTDENGSVRFTDDLYQVPEAQRSSLKTFESEKSLPYSVTEESSNSEEMDAADPSGTNEIDKTGEGEQTDDSATSSGNSREETFQVRAVELNKMQLELNNTRTALEKERMELEAQAPKGRRVKTSERIAYSVKVDALNAKIVQYDKDLKAFEAKVAEFNNRKKVKQE